MEQPPLIDIEPEGDGKSTAVGCVGCLSNLIPVLVVFLVVALIAMGVGWLIWGKDLREKGEELVGKAGSAEKAGEAGAATAEGAGGQAEVSKAAQDGSGDGIVQIEVEGTGDGSVSSAQDAEGVEVVAGGSSRRGGTFGSSTGTPKAGGVNNQYEVWAGDFATAGSDLRFEMIFQGAGDQLQFRCFVMPYDVQTARYFRGDKGDLLLSFHSLTGEPLVPGEGNVVTLPLSKMTAFESRGEIAGWVTRGTIPLNGNEFSDLKSVKLAWDFDQDLGVWLKDLKKNRGK